MDRKYSGQRNIYLPSIDSTNNELFRIIETRYLPEGTVLWTDHQYAGRGLGKTIWESEKGKNIIASLLFYPQFLEPAKQFYLLKTISLGVCDAVDNFLKNRFTISIKWPNDVLVGEKKIAGILIENIIEGGAIKCSVAGIGINANQRGFGDLQSKATSLKNLTGKYYDIPECIAILSEKIQRRYDILKRDRHDRLDNDYLDRLFRYGEKAKYRSGERVFEAIICGVDKYGKLLLKNEYGNIESFDYKELQFVD